MSGNEEVPASSPVGRDVRSKRRVEDSWPDGHHSSKSAKTNDDQFAPQIQGTPEVAEAQEAFESQRRLLGILTGMIGPDMSTMPTGTPQNDSLTPSSTSSESGEGTDQFYLARSDSQGSMSRESTPRPDPTVSLSMRQPSNAGRLRINPPRVLSPLGRDTAPHSSVPGLPATPFTFAPAIESSSTRLLKKLPPSTVSDSAKVSATKGKGKAASAFIEDGDFSLPPWPSRPLPTYSQEGESSASIPSARNHVPRWGALGTPPFPPPQIPNTHNQPPSNTQPPDTVVTDSLASVMSFFSMGMNHLLSSVQQSDQSSRKFITSELDAFRDELKGLKDAMSQQLETKESLPTEVVALLDGVTVPGKPRRRARPRAHFVPSSSNEHRSALHNDDREVHFRFMVEAVRAHSLYLLHVKDYKYLGYIKCTLTDEEHEAFNLDAPGCPQPSATTFMVDCAHPRDSPFNTTAAGVFAQDFLAKVRDNGWYSRFKIPERYLNPQVIQAAFKTHTIYIRACHKEFVVGPQEDFDKAVRKRKTKLQKGSRYGRKKRLLKARLEAMVDHPVLKKHVPLIKYLGTQAISSDESEDEHKRTISYPRVYPRWRSSEIATILWQSDAAREVDESTPLGRRKKPGTQFRLCPHSHKFNDDAPAPIGLPRNCYDSEWLAGLTERKRKELCAQEKDYVFSVVQNGPVHRRSGRYGGAGERYGSSS